MNRDQRTNMADRTGKPLVSVIVPVYNGSKTIAQTITSVLIQELPLEIIIVDDHSDDDLAEALNPFMGNPGIRLIRNQENLGVAQSRNKGVLAAAGRYIAYVDCDDWWEPGKLKRQLALMKKTGCVLCASGRRLVRPDGTKTKRVIPVSPVIREKDLLFQNPITCSSVVVRRDVAIQFPMKHDECHEDYLTWFEILKTYHTACAVNRPLVNYRMSEAGKSGNKINSARMTYRTYRCMGFGPVKAAICFAGYAVNGIRKYLLS